MDRRLGKWIVLFITAILYYFIRETQCFVSLLLIAVTLISKYFEGFVSHF